MDILTKMKQFNRGDYQRDNFDAFLKKEKFNFNIPSVHIAGSNGKGSTAYYISSILKNAGYKVGSFTNDQETTSPRYQPFVILTSVVGGVSALVAGVAVNV